MIPKEVCYEKNPNAAVCWLPGNETEERTCAGGKIPGRGAYVCPSKECLRRAIKSGALARGFETTIPPEVLQQLEQQMEATDDA